MPFPVILAICVPILLFGLVWLMISQYGDGIVTSQREFYGRELDNQDDPRIQRLGLSGIDAAPPNPVPSAETPTDDPD